MPITDIQPTHVSQLGAWSACLPACPMLSTVQLAQEKAPGMIRKQGKVGFAAQ